MKGLIIKNNIKCSTYLKEIFENIKEFRDDYNWLITYPECYPQTMELKKIAKREVTWTTGLNLTEALLREDPQWIWGVFSAFSKTIKLSEVLKYPLPYADGNQALWKLPINVQNPLAKAEIVAWDGLCTLVIAEKNEIITKIEKLDQFTEDLETYIKIS
jgi:hypothetical protein